MTCAFVLGREPALSIAEILAVLEREGIFHDKKTAVFSREALILETERELPPDLFHSLGGSVKFGVIFGKTENIDADLLGRLKALGKAALDFGVSLYDGGAEKKKLDGLTGWMKVLPLELKKKLKEAGISSRAVLPKEGRALTSVQVDKNRLVENGAELLVVLTAVGTFLGRTLAVQKFEEFSERDFGRPGRDAKSGMLPPKLARIMINLSKADRTLPLLDPFCGSGTVLSEAALLGYKNLIGSDLSSRAFDDTRKNFGWTLKEAGIEGVSFNVFTQDARTLHKRLDPGSVDAIVTEPYLGPPLEGKESDQRIHRVFTELMALYLDAFRSFRRVLKPGAAVVFVFPFFPTAGSGKHANILGELREMGFAAEGLLPGRAAEAAGSKSTTGLSYRRPDQKVGRDVYRFRYQKR